MLITDQQRKETLQSVSQLENDIRKLKEVSKATYFADVWKSIERIEQHHSDWLIFLQESSASDDITWLLEVNIKIERLKEQALTYNSN